MPENVDLFPNGTELEEHPDLVQKISSVDTPFFSQESQFNEYGFSKYKHQVKSPFQSIFDDDEFVSNWGGKILEENA